MMTKAWAMPPKLAVISQYLQHLNGRMRGEIKELGRLTAFLDIMNNKRLDTFFNRYCSCLPDGPSDMRH